jgi:type I restriction enzyme S subunit
MPIEFHRDGPWEVPDGWVWMRLGAAVDLHDARRVPVNAKQREIRIADKAPAELFPYYGATGQVGLIDGFLFDGEYVLLGEDGAPFLERSRPKSYIASGKFWVNNHAHILSAKELSTNRFLMHYLNYADYTEFVGGTTRLKLTQADLVNIPVPIPPSNEQRRIAARIDELFTEIADGETALARARGDLDTWRRALLQAAVTGDLTREWRERNRPNDTGADLVVRFRRARPQVGSTLRGWSPSASERIPDIPDTWAWCAVEEAGEVQLGRQRAPQHHAGENMRPYLRVANVFEDALDLSDVKSMNFTPKEFKTFALKAGDILLNEGQTPDFLGRPAIYNDEIDGCCFQKTLLRFRSQNGILPHFALIVFRHYMRSGRFKREARITTNMAHLTQVRFVVMEFPVPPTAEQAEIVRCFRLLDGEASDPFELVRSLTIGLRQSVLKTAFEGRLVGQDPRDEPAERLLARLADCAPQSIPAFSRGRRSRGSVGAGA